MGTGVAVWEGGKDERGGTASFHSIPTTLSAIEQAGGEGGGYDDGASQPPSRLKLLKPSARASVSVSGRGGGDGVGGQGAPPTMAYTTTDLSATRERIVTLHPSLSRGRGAAADTGAD